ncbi:porin [Noviherbaspirillum sp. CPCC 100848]|uniref:Porin n=1 Tax=Noviherbaspirillum album TaxID=3080276 RepID=A0ABU6JG83_9BURK|nr:porin [Noviherbaspirillum sp. CPCC 100848]MEC4722535.1 porin [Noviherbaspirillum sp. CPCC 100848]
MKKSLLALAVLGSFAGVASAQTNVTIYGIVDVAIQRVDSDATSAAWQMEDGNGNGFNRNGSRIGFKGSEDLGGGLSAIFTLENGFTSDSGNLGQGGRLFGRQAWVGLQGNFGAVRLGRQYTVTHLANDTIDPFNTGFAGAINRVFNGNGVRTDNTLSYALPNLGGFSGQVNYSLGEVAGDNSANRSVGLGLGYANGPINVQFAYHDANGAPAAGAAAATSDTKTAFLGGIYNFGVAKLHAAYQSNEVETLAGARTSDDNNWMLGVSAPLGVGQVMASFIRRDADVVTAARGDLDQYALGYLHNLSKRTNVYTSYARQNDKAATGVDNNVFQVGLQHRF